MQQQIYNVFFFNIGKPCFRGTREKDEYLRNTCDQGKSSEKNVYENTLRSSSFRTEYSCGMFGNKTLLLAREEDLNNRSVRKNGSSSGKTVFRRNIRGVVMWWK